jgi:hypothetical protein
VVRIVSRAIVAATIAVVATLVTTTLAILLRRIGLLLSLAGTGLIAVGRERSHDRESTKHLILGHLPWRLDLRDPGSMQNQKELITAIRNLAEGKFNGAAVEEFLVTFSNLVGQCTVIDSILQISTDEGDELEIGFFTAEKIADVTLSDGKVYSCAYPVTSVRELGISDQGPKWVLTISGEKKFDYNVVKPAPMNDLKKYEASLRRALKI